MMAVVEEQTAVGMTAVAEEQAALGMMAVAEEQAETQRWGGWSTPSTKRPGIGLAVLGRRRTRICARSRQS
jgi:hypothetical protein